MTYPPRSTFRIIYSLVRCSVMDIFHFSVDNSFTDMMYLVILRRARIKVVLKILSFTPKAETLLSFKSSRP